MHANIYAREKENNRLDASSDPFFSSPKIVRFFSQIFVRQSRARLHLFFFLLIAFLEMFIYLYVPMFNVTMKYHLVKKVNWILKNLKKVVKLNNVFWGKRLLVVEIQKNHATSPLQFFLFGAWIFCIWVCFQRRLLV